MNGNVSEQPKGAVPQAVADDVAALASEVRAIQRKASAAWKTALGIWVILLAVIFSYLYFGVYSALKKNLDAETIAAFVIGRANDALEAQGFGRMDSPAFASNVAARLKAEAPGLIQGQLKPLLVAQLDQLPRLREKYTADVARQAPVLIDQGLDLLENDLLPDLNDRFMEIVSREVDGLMDEVDAQLSQAVGDIVAQHRDNLGDLSQKELVRQAVELTLEDTLGPHLDELFKDLDDKMFSVREQMRFLVMSYHSGFPSHRQMLEIRLCQLIEALFKGVAEEAPVSEGLLQDIQSFVSELSDIGLPEETVQGIFREMPTGKVPSLTGVPEEYRARVQERAEMIQARIPKEGIPPEALKRMEEARKRALEAMEKAGPRAGRPQGGAPDMPPEARAKMEEGMKRAEDAREKAMGGAAARPAAPAPGGPPPSAREAQVEGEKKAEEARKAAGQ